MPSAPSFFGSLIFSSLGLAALAYGKSISSPKKMLLGGVLLIYPCLIQQTWLLWVIGAGLTAGLALWKD